MSIVATYFHCHCEFNFAFAFQTRVTSTHTACRRFHPKPFGSVGLPLSGFFTAMQSFNAHRIVKSKCIIFFVRCCCNRTTHTDTAGDIRRPTAVHRIHSRRLTSCRSHDVTGVTANAAATTLARRTIRLLQPSIGAARCLSRQTRAVNSCPTSIPILSSIGCRHWLGSFLP